ncbi:MAG TPA: VOC family protein [Candidatus Limnocylindrales bacterium]|nr:VOC family protein [Candidatus Limnocylindrales bacterium]
MARRGRGRPAHPDVLTPAEWTVLNLWRHGLSMRKIAALRRISLYGVRYHLRNIAGKIGIEGTQALRAWPGFPATSALAARRIAPMTDQLELGPLGQVSMFVKSATAAEAWYRDVLGLRHLFTFGDLVFFDLGGTRLYIHAVPTEDWKPSSILYFTVPDVHAAHASLVARDVHFNGAPHMIHRDEATGTEEWMAFFDDPDGNMLAVMARVPAVAPVATTA